MIAQRLLRKICETCCTSHTPTDSETALFEQHGLPVPELLNHATGCEQCTSGYRGRIGIFEMVEVGETLRAAIDRGANEAEMRGLSLAGSETLFGQGLVEARCHP